MTLLWVDKEMPKQNGGGSIRIKPSLVPFTWRGIVVVALGTVLLVASNVIALPIGFPYTGGYVLTLTSLGIVGLGVLMVLVGIVRRNMYTYDITDSGIAVQKQFLRRSVRRIPFASLSDVKVSQSLIGRLAGFGDIIPITKSGFGLLPGADPTEKLVAEMKNVPHPDEVAKHIMSRASEMSKVSALQ